MFEILVQIKDNMIEIVVIIAVIKAFRALAELKGLNKSLWAWIGGLSYYVPVLIFGFLILPQIFMSGVITIESEAGASIIAIICNLLVGILCCGGAYLYLKSRPNATANTDLDIIDQV